MNFKLFRVFTEEEEEEHIFIAFNEEEIPDLMMEYSIIQDESELEQFIISEISYIKRPEYLGEVI